MDMGSSRGAGCGILKAEAAPVVGAARRGGRDDPMSIDDTTLIMPNNSLFRGFNSLFARKFSLLCFVGNLLKNAH